MPMIMPYRDPNKEPSTDPGFEDSSVDKSVSTNDKPINDTSTVPIIKINNDTSETTT